MSSVTKENGTKGTRMRAEDRRELILKAATQVFGDYGYFGTTTAVVARAAGVSQPYVVRVFGTKEKLFLEVLQRALDLLMHEFRAALAEESDIPLADRMGLAYVGLASNRGLLLSLMHGFVLGRDPEIGPEARKGFMCVYRFLRSEAGFDADESQRFLAGGMMINTMIGLRMTDDFDRDADVRELLHAAFPQKLDVLLALAEPPIAERNGARA
ncbi:MAG: TetR/AcrR family transcriptional regulator [Microbacteriaceae bacterium]|jgi:AcrR family transcriptional regulator|nr:TetR/AcrR family transcriptional regulator [Microbacteriaceae bacterium]